MREDLTGQKFGYLTVLKKVKTKDKHHSYYLCECRCGNQITVRSDSLKDPRYKSCGCYNRSKEKGNKSLSHGQSRTKLYHVWAGMKDRCDNPKARSSKWYHDRGITYCDDWKDFENFYDWSKKSGYREGLTIDRIDYNKNYEPSNCRWITQKQQCYNTSRNINITYDGRTYCMQQWSEILGINKNTFWRYVRVKNMSIEEIINKYDIKCIDYPEKE